MLVSVMYPFVKPWTSVVKPVAVDAQFDVPNAPVNDVAAGSTSVPRIEPVAPHVGTSTLTTVSFSGGPARPRRNGSTQSVSATAPLGKSSGVPRPWDTATAGIETRAAVRAAPTVTEMPITGNERFWPLLIPVTIRSGFTFSVFSA